MCLVRDREIVTELYLLEHVDTMFTALQCVQHSSDGHGRVIHTSDSHALLGSE